MKRSNSRTAFSICLVGLIVGVTLLALTQPTFAREKNVVLISVFQDDAMVNIDFCPKTRDEIAHLLKKLEYFRVLEKNKTEGLLQELKQNNSRQIDHYMAVKSGKQLGIQLVILATLSEFEYQQENKTRLNEEGTEIPYKKATASVTLYLEALDVNLNYLIFSDYFSGHAVDEVEQHGSPKSMKKLTSLALQEAVEKLWNPIQKAFPARGLVIKKEKKQGNYCIYVDIGRNWGLNKDRVLSFYNRGEKLIHPVTGQTLNAGKGELILHVPPSEIFAEYCIFHAIRRHYKKMDIGVIVEVDPVEHPSERRLE